MYKADLVGAANWQFSLAKELHHLGHTVERLTELAKNVATVVPHDLYVQYASTASESTQHYMWPVVINYEKLHYNTAHNDYI